MDLIKNRYLLVPFLVFFTAYVLDKILLLENIQTYFTRTMSEVNYVQKPVTYEELKEYLKLKERKKVLVYFGNSRALLFNNAYIEKKYPEWILFNFSVPGGSPDYATWWLEKFREEEVKPDFVLLDHSIEIYNSRNKLQIDEVLLNGLDFPFLMKYRDRYSSQEISDFIAKKLFQTYKYRPKLSTIISRMKNDSLELKVYRKWREDIRQKLVKNRGSASAMTAGAGGNAGVMNNEALQKYSEGDFGTYLGEYQFKNSVLDFQQDNTDILKKMRIPHAAIWVRVSRPYFSLIMNKKVPVGNNSQTPFAAWFPEIEKFHNLNKFPFWDMNRDKNYNCDKFSDAGHMAPGCYPDYTDFIFNNIQAQGI